MTTTLTTNGSAVKSDVETLSPTRVILSVEVPFDELKPSIDAALVRISKQINIPGFRKGKAPAVVIEQRVGRGAVLEEAVNEALPRLFDEALTSNDLVPVGRPEVDMDEIKDGEPLKFKATVDIVPEFELPDFSSLTVEVGPAVPSDEDINEQIDSLRGRFAKLNDVERACADGDIVLVDIAGATDTGDLVEDLTAQALSYEIGTDGLLPGFDDAVRGAKKDELRSFDFTPQNGDWDGITLVVEATVKAVRERELPALDDDFAQLASEFDTVDELKADIRTRMERLKRLEQGAEARNKVLEVLLEAVEIPLPENVIEAEVEAHFADGHEGDDDHRAEVAKGARDSLKGQFILDKIAQGQDISVGETDLQAWLIQQGPRYGMSPDQFAQALVEAGQVPMAMADIRRAKALALVLEEAKVVDTDGNAVDLKALDSDLSA